LKPKNTINKETRTEKGGGKKMMSDFSPDSVVKFAEKRRGGGYKSLLLPKEGIAVPEI